MLQRHARYRSTLAHPLSAGFVWVIVVTLPFLFMGMFLSLDMSKIVIAHYQVQLAAESAALAGAQEAQIDTNSTPAINYDEAMAATQQELTNEYNAYASPDAEFNPNANATIWIQTTTNPNTVTVTIKYKVTGLILMGYFNATAPTYSVSSTAFLCVPQSQTGTSVTQSGDCSTPVGQ